MLLLFALACGSPDASTTVHDSGTSASGSVPVTTSTSPVQSALDVSTGPLASCALIEDGSLLCWGESPVADGVPSGEFSQVSVGLVACALRTDGAVVCWGDDTFDGGIIAGVPEGRFTRVDVGELAACALDEAGTPLCWGALDWIEGALSALAPPSEPLSDLAVGSFTVCGLTTDSAVTCWGADEEFPPNQPDLDLLDDAPQGELASVVDTYRYAGCRIAMDGGLTCWGAEPDAEVESGIAGAEPEGRFVTVAVDHVQACALDTLGAPHCWGARPTLPPDGTFVALSAGFDHACAVRADGGVTCWGEDDVGETQIPPSLAR